MAEEPHQEQNFQDQGIGVLRSTITQDVNCKTYVMLLMKETEFKTLLVMQSSVLKSRILELLTCNVTYILKDREASHRLRGYLAAHGFMLRLVRAHQVTIIITVRRAANLRNLEMAMGFQSINAFQAFTDELDDIPRDLDEMETTLRSYTSKKLSELWNRCLTYMQRIGQLMGSNAAGDWYYSHCREIIEMINYILDRRAESKKFMNNIAARVLADIVEQRPVFDYQRKPVFLNTDVENRIKQFLIKK